MDMQQLSAADLGKVSGGIRVLANETLATVLANETLATEDLGTLVSKVDCDRCPPEGNTQAGSESA